MARKRLYELMQATKEDNLAKIFLDNYIYTVEHEDDERPPSKTFKPSSIKCIRHGVLQCFDIRFKDKPKTSQTLIEICRSGSDTHKAIQETVYKMKFGWEFEDVGEYVKKHKLDLEIIEPSDFENGIFETKLYSKRYNMRFLCDGILSHRKKGARKREYMIFEIKTASSSKFFHLEDVLDEHKAQATAYSMLLGINDVLFMYSDRNILSKKTFIYTPTKEEKEALSNKIDYGILCVEQKIVPAKPVEASNKFCSMCEYYKICDKCGDDEIKLRKVKL